VPPGEAMPKARAAAEQALAIGPPAAGALAALACVQGMYEWSWTESERQFRRAIDVMPGASSARTWYAMNCLIPLGRFDEAEVELRRALEIDPLSAPAGTALGIRSYFARRYEDAVRQLTGVLDLEAHFRLARQFLGLALGELGRHEDARQAMGAARSVSDAGPEMVAAAGYLLARAGDAAGARARLDELVALSASRYISPGLIAQVHAGLGRHDEAVASLEQALAVRAADLAWLGVRPVFDRLRGDARFQALRARTGLAHVVAGV